MTDEELLQVIEEALHERKRILILSFKRLTSLPAKIGQLTNLTHLDIRGNYFTSLPAEIGQLINLTHLDIRGNYFISLPKEIGQLINLTHLDIRSNKLTSLPEEIGQLTNLTHLDIRGNQLTKLPTEIGQLTNISHLYFSSNKLTSLPTEIGLLRHITDLSISSNNLTSLPAEIVLLEHLVHLDISSNSLIELPYYLGLLPKLSKLIFNGNKLESPPPEILAKGSNAVIQFLRQQVKQETERLYEAKLLVVGEGGAGKTTLAKKIQNSNYQLNKEEITTEGIDIIHWKFPLNNGKEFQINIWDFGGQEIYHATHQFFLTERSLYLLVADTRTEDTDFYYWLNIVELLSNNSPVMIIKNEKQERKREINERQLRGEFTNLKETLATNLAINRGLPEILNQIQHYISNLPHVGTELPKNWVKVREELENNPHDYISKEEYLRICREHKFQTDEDALQLSEYLHDLGVCLHFQKDDLLERIVILKPSWGTDAVYKVLDNPQVIQNLGKFCRQDLKNIWCDKKYADMLPELLQLMMNFKLCYEIPSCRDTYIAPQLLTLNKPEYEWDESNNLLLRYTYDFMPKGILTRFIVEMHQWIENQSCVWRTGVVLAKDETKAEAIELYHKREIQIRISGKHKRDLLVIVRHEFNKINSSYGERLKYKTLVPCNCKVCSVSKTPHFYDLARLNQFMRDGKDIQCPESYEMVKVRGLIDDVISEQTRTNSRNPREDNAISKEDGIWDKSNMSNPGKYTIHANVVQITEKNLGEVIGNKYDSDPAFQNTLREILVILANLQNNNPNATEKEAEEIIEAEFTEIKHNQPEKWKNFQRQIFDRKRWLNSGKNALSEVAKHYVEGNVFYKAGISFIDGFTSEWE